MTIRRTLVDAVCSQRRQIRVVIAVVIAMGLLLLLSFTAVEPGDRAYPILVLDAVLVVVSLVFFSATYYLCTKREMDD